MVDERKPVVGVVVPASGYTPTREQFEAAGRKVMEMAREQRVRDAAPEMLALLRVLGRTDGERMCKLCGGNDGNNEGHHAGCSLAALLARIDGKAGDRG